jgi:glycosyltransferase involved in cell wall biosynthesis
MSKQLDILALEPFYGGGRRSMLETMIRCSRHRWTLLKLPPRRIERRLAAAAHWFAEQLSRHSVGHFDLLFTSEALNLADLYRVMPALAEKPAVVYFHDNQLPALDSMSKNSAVDFANMNTASAATEIWFNSKYHVRVFLAELSALVSATEELATQNPIEALTGKIRFVPPPVDISAVREIQQTQPVQRQPLDIFVETRRANLDLLNQALAVLQRRGDKVQLLTVGPVQGLIADFPRQTFAEDDLSSQTQGLLQASVFMSARVGATFDEHAIRALALGCRVVLPMAGVYPELLPKAMRGFCLYEVDPESMASRIQDALYQPDVLPGMGELTHLLQQYDPIVVCKAIDERLSEVSQKNVPRKVPVV